MTNTCLVTDAWLVMQEFQKEKVEPLKKTCDETRRVGQALIQSAAAGVSTADIEFNLQTLNTAWSTLSDRVLYLLLALFTYQYLSCKIVCFLSAGLRFNVQIHYSGHIISTASYN